MNCSGLTESDRCYRLVGQRVITSEAGLRLERHLAAADLVEVITWLLIVLSIEIVVRLPGRGIAHSHVITAANISKIALYRVLFAIAAYWATLSHWPYAWDEFLWIAGFAAIEMNVSEWRDELARGEQQAA